MLDLGFDLVRVSAYWDEIHDGGYEALDRLLDLARSANQAIVLTVGMKAMGWPEFYVPSGVAPDARRDGRVGVEAGFVREVVSFVTATVARYRDRAGIVAWQVENEPFNRSGPRHWWIDEGLVRHEIRALRALDSRPIILNAFAHFDAHLDSESRPRRGPFGITRLVPERAILRLTRPGDVLGLDVYNAIGAAVDGETVVRRCAPDWAASAGGWLRAARGHGRDAWIIEAQAEPWEPSRDAYADPVTFAPGDIQTVHDGLAGAGYSVILLWGCEYWFWRAAAGDTRWVEAVSRIPGAPRR